MRSAARVAGDSVAAAPSSEPDGQSLDPEGGRRQFLEGKCFTFMCECIHSSHTHIQRSDAAAKKLIVFLQFMKQEAAFLLRSRRQQQDFRDVYELWLHE